MSAKIKELREKQKVLITSARAKLEEIKDDTAEARAKEIEIEHDKIYAEHDRLDGLIKREQQLIDAEARLAEATEAEEKRAKNRRPNGGDANQEERGGDKPSDKKVFRKLMQFGAGALSEEERGIALGFSVNITSEMRAMAAGAPAAGGYMVPQGFSGEIDRALLAYGPMLDPGVTRQITTDSGNLLPWPTLDDTAQLGALLAENTAAATQDIAVGNVNMNAYMYTSKIIQVSFQLLQDSAFDVQSEIIDPAFGERIGRIVNQHLTTGTGAGAQPNGIVTASGLGKTTAAVGAVTPDEIIDFYHSIDPAYRASPNFRFMFNDSTLLALRKLKDTMNRYMIDNLRDGQAVISIGGIAVPYSINQAMASMATTNKFMVGGDFRKYVVRRVKEMTILRLNERYADALQVGFVGFARFDGNLLNSAAVKHMRNA